MLPDFDFNGKIDIALLSLPRTILDTSYKELELGEMNVILLVEEKYMLIADGEKWRGLK